MRKLLLLTAVAAAAVIPALFLAAPAAVPGMHYHDGPVVLTAARTPGSHRITATVNVFDMKNNSSGSDQQGCLIVGPGNGNEFFDNGGGGTNCGNGSHSDLSLIDKVIVNGVAWYEIENLAPFGCFNAHSDTGVYNDSCAGTTTMQWRQIIVSDGQHWENRHFGTNGYLSVNCGFFTCGAQVVATSSPISWATPES